MTCAFKNDATKEYIVEFATSDALTFGLELEFQIVNQSTGLLSPSSLEIWQKLSEREDLSLIHI